ncbi:MAG: acetyl-CoA hydrolase/transferase C-terminal domain-containing protein [Paracoccaceae bacterium]
MTLRHDDPGPIVDAILAHTGGNVVLGLPLGLGKAPAIANALFDRAAGDPAIRLRIFTALTLEPPPAGDGLAGRFVGPLVERLFAGWPELHYARALREGSLPANVDVNEFFLLAGRWKGIGLAQRSYIPVNYSDAPALLRRLGVNVIAQLVAERPREVSLSCNPDITLPLIDLVRAGTCLLVGQTNAELPFMAGPAALPESDFAHILTGHDFPLFAPPNQLVSDADHAIGLRVAALVPDGGTLQIGIGSIGDAVGAALIMRHKAPDLFAATLERLGPWPDSIGPPRTDRFDAGLYGCSEMVVPAFLELMKSGVIRRRANDGALLHGGFFVGPRGFYRDLCSLPDGDVVMGGIGFTNTLFGDEEIKRRDRRGARFVNNAMMATLRGDIVSDALENGQVISGTGGQHDFITQAFALDDARAIVALNATRAGGQSNIVWTYGNTTIPRALRDIVVTEHGIADLRGVSEAECVRRMLAVADPRCLGPLRRAAAEAGYVPENWRLPAANTPDRIETALRDARAEGWCAPFPFGTDLTPDEQDLAPALSWLRERMAGWRGRARLLGAAFEQRASEGEARLLARLDLARPRGGKDRLLKKLVLHAMRRA